MAHRIHCDVCNTNSAELPPHGAGMGQAVVGCFPTGRRHSPQVDGWSSAVVSGSIRRALTPDAEITLAHAREMDKDRNKDPNKPAPTLYEWPGQSIDDCVELACTAYWSVHFDVCPACGDNAGAQLAFGAKAKAARAEASGPVGAEELAQALSIREAASRPLDIGYGARRRRLEQKLAKLNRAAGGRGIEPDGIAPVFVAPDGQVAVDLDRVAFRPGMVAAPGGFDPDFDLDPLNPPATPNGD